MKVIVYDHKEETMGYDHIEETMGYEHTFVPKAVK